jgi:long-chain acyl-CoA synthetase
VTTLLDVFRLLDTKRGEFVVHDDGYRVRRFSYADVTRGARAFAARLAAAGVAQGETLLIWGENCAEWLAAYWGAVIAGVVVVPIDYRSSLEFAARVSGLVGAKVAMIGDEVRETRLAAGADAPPFGPAAGRVWWFSEFDWGADAPMPPVSIDRGDVAQIVFTSGATAEPRGVVVRHKNLMANLVPVAAETARYTPYARPFLPIRFLNLLPLSHLFGQSMATTIPPLVDGTVVFMRSVNPHDIVRRVKEWRISVIVCVPKILEVLQEHARRLDPAAGDPPAGLSIPTRWWRYRRLHRAFGLKFWAFVVGAAPLVPALEEFWKRLGFVVIQGYGLTETAPIVTLNHPFKTSTGSVGRPVAGVEVTIAPDGEILVRGENVTEGYYETERSKVEGPGSPAEGPRAAASAAPAPRTRDAEGWLHTGDIGEMDASGRLFIRGRKKEMIVTPDGLNVFPDDVEREIGSVPGVIESAVVGRADAGTAGANERVHAVLVLAPGTDPNAVLGAANARLAEHQRIREFSVWTAGPLPRTEGTKKLKRAEIKAWVSSGAPPVPAKAEDAVEALLSRFAGGRPGSLASIESLALSSLERVELMVALEDAFQTRIDEARFATVRTLDDLKSLVQAPGTPAEAHEPVDFPRWNRGRLAGVVRRVSLATWILPLARVFAWIRVSGLEHLDEVRGPVLFAANHQSHFDVPVILAALPGRWRTGVAPAMAKEFFKPHFFPGQYRPWQVITNRLNYYLAALFFNAFPLPQREAGARHTLRYIGEMTGDGFSVLIFPEGARSATGDIKPFRGGVGMMASRLRLPVVPVRLHHVDHVLHPTWKMARPARCGVTFGAPMRLGGDDYAALAREVEHAVRRLPVPPGA